jgi:hypothetical protein
VIALLAAAPVSAAAAAHHHARDRGFRPRIGAALGIVPPPGHPEIAVIPSIPLLYHGGSVMRNVTIHTIFWAPSGFQFDGPPSGNGPGYQQLIEQFLTDVAHDSATSSNALSVLNQYGDSHGQGSYSISYNASTDSINATDPYPPPGHRCASPAGITVCVTDLQLQQEIDKVIGPHNPSARGLTNVWFVFLPPDVDTCVVIGSCGSNVFGGYHSLLNLGDGATVYSPVPDPLIEGNPPPGSDPQGNPEAETAIDVAAHELVEAVSDPEGAGWMDPNGFEVGDKCESGPQRGTPLGFAANGSPYNQVINANRYLIQTMWSNVGPGCVQRSTATTSPLPLANVNLNQFSPSVSGSIGSARGGVGVTVALARAGTVVARGSGRTSSSGSWGPISLRSVSSRGDHAVGDDRDELLVSYGSHGPLPDLVETGQGGNAFTESGWTGWFDLDHGYSVAPRGVLLAPCSQVGVLGVRINGTPTSPPVRQCQTETNVAVLHTGSLGQGTSLSLSSQDNRAISILNTNGALVKLTVAMGEPESVSAIGNSQILFEPSGFPSCTADLRAQSVRCTGLLPGARYTLTRRRNFATRRTSADGNGAITVTGFPGRHPITGGDAMTLKNDAGRRLTALHVAHLRVALDGQRTVIAAGTCESGDYYGAPLSSPPISGAVGIGVGGTGTICPSNGRAGGLSASNIAQTDDFSGGQTRTQVPEIEATAPVSDETLYGAFVASAQTGLPGPNGSVFATSAPVALTITRARSRRQVFHARNVDTAAGVAVRGLARGAYVAKWVLSDANGDTRTVRTRFFEQR